MKYAFVLLATIMSAQLAFAQSKTPAEATPPGNWSQLGPTVEGPRGFTLHGKGIRVNARGQYELSVRITPVNQAAFVKRYDLPKTTGYVVQFATVDCDKKLVSLERTEIYGASEQVIEGKVTGITPSSNKEAVRPGSIGEAVFKFVCVESTSLPMTKTGN